MSWYLAVIKDYAVFDGRAGRSEYWMFFLVNLLVAIALAVVDSVIGTFDVSAGMGLLGLVYMLAVLLPGIGVTIRRLHDTGRSGWWILVGFIPLIGGIILLVLMVLKGTNGDNAYGPPARLKPGH